jgi:DNA-binding beta-propeller fold protein YncE
VIATPWTRLAATLVVLAALGCLATAAGAQTSPPQLTLTVVDSLPLPPGRAQGLAWIGADTLAVLLDVPDSLSATGRRETLLSFLDRRGEVMGTANFTGSLARGLAYDGTSFWSCGDEQDGGSLIYRIAADTLAITDAFPTAGHHPCGLSWDGEFVWVTDRDSGRLDRFDRDTEGVTRSILTPGFSPCGVAHLAGFIWVCDSGTGRLYRLRGARGQWTGTVGSDFFAFRGRDVLLASDGYSLWFAPVGAASVYRAQLE